MEKLNLNEFLRYGFSGALFLLSLILAFEEPLALAKTLPTDFFGASALLGSVLVTGSVIYAVHRSIVYLVIYKILVLRIYCERSVSIKDLDFMRWERYKNPESTQQFFREWASQIHFLYCALWAIVLAQPVGWTYNWTHTNKYWVIWIVAAIVGIAALISHWRYLSYERNLIREC